MADDRPTSAAPPLEADAEEEEEKKKPQEKEKNNSQPMTQSQMYATGAIAVIALLQGMSAGAGDAVTTHLLVMVAGLVYPAYVSFYAIISDGKDDDRHWVVYWVIFHMFELVYSYFSFIISGMALFSAFELWFVVWLWFPMTHGHNIMFHHILKPYCNPTFKKINDTVSSEAPWFKKIMSNAGFLVVIVFIVWFMPVALMGIACNFVGVVIPAILSYNAVRKGSDEEAEEWLTYWLIFAPIALGNELEERVGLGQYIPYFYTMQLLFMVWLWFPFTKGARLIYRLALKKLKAE